MNPVTIYRIRHSERLDEKTFNDFMLLLPASFKAEINAYKHWESAQASLLGKMVLSYGLKEMQPNYSLSDLLIGNKDRPYIHPDLDFNISHSGEYVVVAITQNAKVGIDIEKHRKLDVGLFRKYFDEHEWNEIQHGKDKLQTFFELWTIKESAIKCDGRGVEILSQTHVGDKSAHTVQCDGHAFYYRLLPTEANYACCVCSDQEMKVAIKDLTLEELKSTP